MKKKLMFIVGTRPDFIKLVPLIIAARSKDSPFMVEVVATGQHRQMFDQVQKIFQIHVDEDLEIMRSNQSISYITAAAMEGLTEIMQRRKPDCVVVQGDTTTTFVGALAAFYLHIPVAHVEAGLRTNDKYQPFPEEINRRLTGQIADYHFAPTEGSKQNLIQNGISENKIWVTGNTCIDALFLVLKMFPEERVPTAGKKEILVTAHRRENQGKPLENICQAILQLRDRHPDLHFFYPVHHSPNVRSVVYPLLGEQERIELVEPLDYKQFILAMDRAAFILSDSGGVQEEAPSLHKPVLVLRNKTERPEGVSAGVLKLVGTETENIVAEVNRLLEDPAHYTRMSEGKNPYGDGNATERILAALSER